VEVVDELDIEAELPVASSSDDAMEDDVGVPAMPIEAANSLGDLVPPKPIGRPKQVVDMEAPLFDKENCMPTKIGEFIHSLHEVFARNNTSEAMGKEVHDILRRTVNPTLPSYKKTVRELRDLTNAKEYAACPNDCSVHPVDLLHLSKAELGQLRCIHCHAHFADKDLKPKKVSFYPGRDRR
jgi:hypothetical protein